MLIYISSISIQIQKDFFNNQKIQRIVHGCETTLFKSKFTVGHWDEFSETYDGPKKGNIASKLFSFLNSLIFLLVIWISSNLSYRADLIESDRSLLFGIESNRYNTFSVTLIFDRKFWARWCWIDCRWDALSREIRSCKRGI